MAERTWKYASVARTKKNTIVSMGEDAAWIEIGRIKALIVDRRRVYASRPKSLRTRLRAVGTGSMLFVEVDKASAKLTRLASNVLSMVEKNKKKERKTRSRTIAGMREARKITGDVDIQYIFI